MATDLCLSVIKYSHAVGVRSDVTIPWVHLQATNLFVIVKGTSVKSPDGQLNPDARLDMRIVRGTEVLESVDVAAFVDASIDVRRRSLHTTSASSVEQLPIFGITREALLALRYRLPDGQARRIQLRLQTPAECRRIVTAFERRGMEFQEQRPATARPGTARPPTTGASDRLPSAQANSPYFEPSKSPPKASPFIPQAVEAGSLSRNSAHSPSHADEQPHSYQSTTRPQLISRDEVNAPRDLVPERPSTAQIYRSYTTPLQPAQSELAEPQRQPRDPTVERPSSTSHVTTLAAIREAVQEDMTPPRTAAEMRQLSTRPSHVGEHWSSATTEPAAALSTSSNAARPSTAASTAPPPDSQEFALPPRRELPFKRPGSRANTSDRGNSRPGSSALTMPPLPRPKLVKDGSDPSSRSDFVSSVKDAMGSRPNTASPLKRAFVADEEPEPRPQTTSAQVYAGSATHAEEATRKRRSPPRDTSSTTTARQPSRMTGLLARTPLSNRSPNRLPRLGSITDAPHELVSPPHSPPKPPTSFTNSTHNPTLNPYAPIPSPTSHHPHEVSLEEYATQSLQDRQAALDDFMVANLENPAFEKLCEDVENCWRRIALGL